MVTVTIIPAPLGPGMTHSPYLRNLTPSRGIVHDLPFRPNVGDVLDVGDGWDNYVTEVHIDVNDGTVMALVSPARP